MLLLVSTDILRLFSEILKIIFKELFILPLFFRPCLLGNILVFEIDQEISINKGEHTQQLINKRMEAKWIFGKYHNTLV